MVQLVSFFPLQTVPIGFGWEDRNMSVLSTTTAFRTGIDKRDTFLGKRRCIVCGRIETDILDHCYIIGEEEDDFWTKLKDRKWIPEKVKEHPGHEPRNGLTMCVLHHRFFYRYRFFIRFLPDSRKFVFVNHSGIDSLQQFHGKAIALDIRDRYVPFPSLFIIHEERVRGFNPFSPVALELPNNPEWQDWILSDGVVNESGTFNRNLPPSSSTSNIASPQPPQFQRSAESVGSTPSGVRRLVLNDDVIAEILAATHASPSWKACMMEGTTWEGTGDENIRKYMDTVGIEGDS
ncbi:uncharacterized protein FOMMEDRAFT_164286 [Fomitiporia mediterranea MF3/22]|uniref:uncharacterized protein n=1 Tax=Fomitiporia mediterranea (strain MF3/22) TaxID=694068 RepID=UPI0004407AB2|nr:uncharacterized protein FOMMEDRAFT_164286 [Fomitiporia mediterranea MF3/22]EJD07263.1 hypothetical protein FOMMEDRAFT_164286 [Fomitiporia mediterranea MF3/22]